jgi:hypothetical protein
VVALAAALAGCRHDDAASSVATAGPPASSAAPDRSGQAVSGAPSASADARLPLSESNPLHLPPRRITLDPGRRVFTFSAEMLAGAKLGSTLVLYAATAVGMEGDDLLIEGRAGPSYRVQSSYVIPVPDDAHLRLNDPVLTEWNGVMKHALVTRFVKDKVGVRYTDSEAKTPEGLLKGARFVRQTEGLFPGNYAALEDGDSYRHVLLVSPLDLGNGSPKRWFALGFGGAALVVDAGSLKPIPVRYTPKAGTAVWAEWVGTLRPATVTGVDDPGLFVVKFDRAGRPATVGVGMLMPPIL